MVGVARLELAASWSRTMRATICATPRCSFFIIMITHTVVKYQFSFLQRNMRNLSILVFGRNVSFCYFHLDSIPESHYNKTTAVSPVLQTLLTTSLETVHCCQSPFFFLSMLQKYKNAATFCRGIFMVDDTGLEPVTLRTSSMVCIATMHWYYCIARYGANIYPHDYPYATAVCHLIC